MSMDNITTEVKDGKLLIAVDVSKATIAAAPPSSTGKSKSVASSHGHQSIDGNGLTLNLNVNYKERR